VAVVGMGYVGLPLAVALAGDGFRVTGFERAPDRLRALRQGRSYLLDVRSADLKTLLASKTLRITHEARQLRDSDVVIICVPTPLLTPQKPDLSFLKSAIESVARHITQPALVVLESTTYPGTTDTLMRSIFERAGHVLDQGIFLAFSPERIDPGNPKFSVRNIPKLVGGMTAKSTALAAALYRRVVKRVVPVSSSRVAEMAKLLENTYRSVNIALANEFALLCHYMDVDVWEVIRAAGTKPFGFTPFYPGPGVGGHCIPSDPIYLTWRIRARDITHELLIESAAAVNAKMPRHVVSRVAQLLKRRGSRLRNARVLVLGVAYKRDVADVRDSPALVILKEFRKRGARIQYHDPLVPVVRLDGATHRSAALRPSLLAQSDCVVIVTDHRDVNYPLVGRHAPLIFDARNVMARYPGVRAAVERL
ncbi:MAG: hypothetical protein A3C53_04600, partial [Omnitrophica WOR_2 bacterium RIFCSPHIGHO2_02_FULL_68_15]